MGYGDEFLLLVFLSKPQPHPCSWLLAFGASQSRFGHATPNPQPATRNHLNLNLALSY